MIRLKSSIWRTQRREGSEKKCVMCAVEVVLERQRGCWRAEDKECLSNEWDSQYSFLLPFISTHVFHIFLLPSPPFQLMSAAFLFNLLM